MNFEEKKELVKQRLEVENTLGQLQNKLIIIYALKEEGVTALKKGRKVTKLEDWEVEIQKDIADNLDKLRIVTEKINEN